jgi:hypothetical protein
VCTFYVRDIRKTACSGVLVSSSEFRVQEQCGSAARHRERQAASTVRSIGSRASAQSLRHTRLRSHRATARRHAIADTEWMHSQHSSRCPKTLLQMASPADGVLKTLLQMASKNAADGVPTLLLLRCCCWQARRESPRHPAPGVYVWYLRAHQPVSPHSVRPGYAPARLLPGLVTKAVIAPLKIARRSCLQSESAISQFGLTSLPTDPLQQAVALDYVWMNVDLAELQQPSRS